MNEYEIMLLLDPELAEERANEIIQRVRDAVESGGGKWDGHEPWGRRRLAYEIAHKGEAVYHLLLFAALVVAAVGAEVNPATFIAKIGNFVSYFDRLLTLESGARVWTDIGEWFWGWRKWTWMLGETILISYVGTLLGAVILGSLRNGLTLLNVQAFYQLLATGIIILVAMLIDRATRGRE